MKTVDYADFECLLLKLGFRPGESAGGPEVYVYPAFDAVVVMPPRRPEGTVYAGHVVGLRTLCDVKGILDKDAFDALLETIVGSSDCAPEEAITPFSAESYR